MGIPEPPGFKKSPEASSDKVIGDTKPVMDVDEVTFILNDTLLPQHATDPNIIRFISKYLICRHSRQAARESGLAASDGDNLLRRPDIYEAIRKITDRAVMKHGYDASEVVERVKEIVGVDPGELQDPETGAIIENLNRLAPETRRAIKKFKAKNIYEEDPNGMKVVVGKMIEVEFWDKMQGVQLLGREKDLFAEKKKIEHGISSDMRSVLLESKRLALEHIEASKNPEREALPAPIDVTPASAEAIVVEKLMREPNE